MKKYIQGKCKQNNQGLWSESAKTLKDLIHNKHIIIEHLYIS